MRGGLDRWTVVIRTWCRKLKLNCTLSLPSRKEKRALKVSEGKGWLVIFKFFRRRHEPLVSLSLLNKTFLKVKMSVAKNKEKIYHEERPSESLAKGREKKGEKKRSEKWNHWGIEIELNNFLILTFTPRRFFHGDDDLSVSHSHFHSSFLQLPRIHTRSIIDRQVMNTLSFLSSPLLIT